MSHINMHHSGHIQHQHKDHLSLPKSCANAWHPHLQEALIERYVSSLGGDFRLPNMPDVVIAVERELKSRYPNMKKIADIIEGNLVISGEVLAHVNTDNFQRNMRHKIEIKSIEQCINLIGTEKTYRLVVASAIRNLLGKGVLFRSIMEHSAKVANICVEIAGYTREITLESAFLYGLFMHGGMVLLASRYDENYRKLFEFSMGHPKEALEKEISVIGARHDYLGVAVARKWGIGQHPDNDLLHREDMAMLLAIQEHHHPQAQCIADHTVRVLIAIGRMAIFMTNDMVYRVYQSEDAKQEYEAAKSVPQLSDEAISTIRMNIAQTMNIVL